MAQRRRWRRRTPTSVERHPATGERVNDLTSAQLQQRLVSDAVKGYPEAETMDVSGLYLIWQVAALQRIARLDGIKLDDAYVRVRTEAASLGATMPSAPGS